MGMVHIIHGILQGEWVVQNVDDCGDLEEFPKWSRRCARGWYIPYLELEFPNCS